MISSYFSNFPNTYYFYTGINVYYLDLEAI